MEENGTATVRMANFAQEQLGEVVFVDLPEEGADRSALIDIATYHVRI